MAKQPYQIRPYTSADRAACLAIYDSNLPHALTPAERDDFVQDLDAMEMHYFVVTDQAGQVVACGGFDPDRDTLCWGMVAKPQHGKGIGSFFLRERLRMLRDDHGAVWVTLDTSQFSRGFFEKHGFRVVRIVEDGYAPGIHRHDMVLELPAGNT